MRTIAAAAALLAVSACTPAWETGREATRRERDQIYWAFYSGGDDTQCRARAAQNSPRATAEQLAQICECVTVKFVDNLPDAFVIWAAPNPERAFNDPNPPAEISRLVARTFPTILPSAHAACRLLD